MPGLGLESALSPLGHSYVPGAPPGTLGTITETVGVTSFLAGTMAYSVELVEGIGIADDLHIPISIEDVLEDTVDLTDAVGYPLTWEDFLADGVEIVDVATGGLLFEADTIYGVGFTDWSGLGNTYEDAIVNSLGVSPRLLETRRYGATIETTIPIVEELLSLRGIIVSEGIGTELVLNSAAILHQTLVQALLTTDALHTQIPATLIEDILAEDALGVYQAVLVAERLGIRPIQQSASIRNVRLTQGMRIRPLLLRFLGANAFDDLGVDPALFGYTRGQGTLVQGVGIDGEVTPRFLIHAVMSDQIDIQASEILQSFIHGNVVEGVEISAAYLAPDGNFTTWAMNARTGAVTEYSDYEFNSFANMGNRYLGASTGGLYLLLGDTDDGEDIIGRIKSGLMQFGGTRLSRLKAAYIAARGEGDYILRIVDGDDTTYDYAVSTRNQRSTKVHMGKGQRSRYFSFELVSAGQDFDLDTIEFVPVLVRRRV